MTTQPERIDALNQLLRQTPPLSPIRRHPDDGVSLAAGQLWSAAAVADHADPDSIRDTPTWLLMLIEPIGDEWFNAVPVFRWTELAGPDDLILSQTLAGARMAAALGLEATINRAMLAHCQGRFQSDVLNFLLSARAAASDPVKRNAYCWGAPYVGPRDHRIEYAAAISSHLESLQSVIRDGVFAEPTDQTDGADSPAAWQPNIRSYEPVWFERYREPAAAASGEQLTPCVLLPEETPARDRMVRETSADGMVALCIGFDPLIPGAITPVCCEWIVSGTFHTLPAEMQALVYDSRSGKQIGIAEVHCRKDGLLLILSSHNLSPDDPPVDDPAVLRIVIVPRL